MSDTQRARPLKIKKISEAADVDLMGMFQSYRQSINPKALKEVSTGIAKAIDAIPQAFLPASMKGLGEKIAKFDLFDPIDELMDALAILIARIRLGEKSESALEARIKELENKINNA